MIEKLYHKTTVYVFKNNITELFSLCTFAEHCKSQGQKCNTGNGLRFLPFRKEPDRYFDIDNP